MSSNNLKRYRVHISHPLIDQFLEFVDQMANERYEENGFFAARRKIGNGYIYNIYDIHFTDDEIMIIKLRFNEKEIILEDYPGDPFELKRKGKRWRNNL